MNEFTERFVLMIKTRGEIEKQAHEIALAYMAGRPNMGMNDFIEKYIEVKKEAFGALFSEFAKNQNEKAEK